MTMRACTRIGCSVSMSTTNTRRLVFSVPMSTRERATAKNVGRGAPLALPTSSAQRRHHHCFIAVAAASSSASDDSSSSSSSIPPSTPQEASSSQRSSYAGNKAIAIPWYHITAARTFLAVSSLKMLALTLPTSYFATTMLSGTGGAVPLGFWQSLLAAAAGAALALLAKKLDERPGGFASTATRAQWVGLVAAGVASCVLFAKLVPGRTLVDIRRERLGGGGGGVGGGRAAMMVPPSSQQSLSRPQASADSGGGRSGARPMPLKTAADANAMLAAMERKGASASPALRK